MPFRKTPIKRKLTLVILATSSAALLLACAGFILFELVTFRQTMVSNLTVLADVLATNSNAAVAFHDVEAAEETLGALNAEPQILSACLYTAGNGVFASYARTPSIKKFPEKPGADGHRFESDRLLLSRPIVLNNKRIGTIYIEAGLGGLYARLKLYAAIVGIVLFVASIAAFAVSSILQRVISGPILALATTAKLISENKDYSVRASRQSEDELGTLTDAFNQMLSGIEERRVALLHTNKVLQEEIAGRTQAEEQLKSLNEELERRVVERTEDLQRSNEELERFAYVASHDLQEPLRMVGSYMQLLERRYKDKLDEDANKFIGFAVDGAKRMQALIQDLLAFSRVGSKGKAFEPTDCAGVLEIVLSNLKVAIGERKAAVTCDTLPTVMADPGQIGQLFQNLISNGLKFRGKEPPNIHISARLDGDLWVFSVRDNGIGIDPQFFERIFIIFQRLHARGDYPGTGIGLAVCKKIVERHGGRIWAESAPGAGTTFYFTLPAKIC